MLLTPKIIKTEIFYHQIIGEYQIIFLGENFIIGSK